MSTSDIDHLRTYQQFSPSELRPNYPQSPEDNIRLVSEQENSPEASHELLSASAFLKRLQGDKDQLTNPQTSVSSRNADSRDNMSFRGGNNGPWSKGVPTAFSTRETSALPEAYQRPPLPARPVSRSPLREKPQQTNIPPRPVLSNSQSSYNSKPTNNQWSQGHSFRDNSHLASTLPEAGRTHTSGLLQNPSAGKNYTEKVQMSFASVNLREDVKLDPVQRESAPDQSSKPRLTTGQGESIYYLQQEIGMCTNEGISPIKHPHDMLSAVQGERTSKYSGLNLDMSVINQTIDDCGNESRLSEAGLDTPVMKALSSIQGKIEELNMMMGKTASRRSARKSDFYDRSRQKTVTESGMKSIDPRQTLNSYATSAEKENYPFVGMHSLAFPDRQEAWSKKETDQEWMLRSGTTDLQLQPYTGGHGDASEAQETYLVTSGATSRRLYA